MTVINNPLRPTEYRFTGVFLPVGRDHVLADRRGHACAVVGYDLDLDRDAPLTFLARFADGFESHVFPEEVDDHAPYRKDNPPVPPAPQDGEVPGAERFRQVRELGDRIVSARFARHQAMLFGDRFDGTPNSDHYRGEEAALRGYAEAFGFEVPSEAEAQERAIARLEDEHPESDTIADFVRALRAGEGWEGRG